MKGDVRMAPLFSVWQIDAWMEDGSWYWNDKYKLFMFRSNACDVKHAFLSRLRRYIERRAHPWISRGMWRGWHYATDDQYIMELRKRRDDCPVYACIRETP